MKTETKLTILVICLIIGIALLIWGNVIMIRYEGFREIWKAARHAALPQFIIGFVILVGAYILTYIKKK
jgi:vacuolar-type H+-ATPase subunit I/STV1